jgi:predicted O-methyltransferase YrrM
MTETHLVDYLTEYHAFKDELFGLYGGEGARLATKESSYGMGTARGFWLAEWEGRRASAERTAASIGDDEIKLFYDVCQLVRPSLSYVIGNSFGLSTFCLALAWPAGRVAAIDNWSEPDTQVLARPLTERIVAARGWERRVHIHTGSSPGDTPAALAAAGGGPVSLFFIDGWHRDPAALADFVGALPHLDRRSVVFWHNVNEVAGAFEFAYRDHARELFDEHVVLRTQGPMGVYYNRTEHPGLHTYLTDSCLVWRDFDRLRQLLENQFFLRRMLELRDTPSWKLAKAVSWPLRRIRRIGRSA